MITGTTNQRLYEKASNTTTPNYLLTVYPYPRSPYLSIQGHVLGKLKKSTISFLITSPNTSSANRNLSHLLTGASAPHHMLKPPQSPLLILSSTEATPTLSRIPTFLILSLLVCPHIYLNILIPTTCIF